MTIKTFFIVLICGFILYELVAIPIGVIKKKKEIRELKKGDKENEIHTKVEEK